MRTSSVAGVVILGGLLAVAVARGRQTRPTRAPARPRAAAAPVHSLDAPRPAVARERMPSRAPMAVVGATALAPARAPNPVPAVRPALRLVAAAPPEPEPLPEPAFEPERLPDFARARWETCRIRIWRGYVTWQLVAESSSTGSAIALSPTFRARRAKGEPTRAPTLNAAARSAFQRLQELLESDGWERVDDGAAWYEGRFRRRA